MSYNSMLYAVLLVPLVAAIAVSIVPPKKLKFLIMNLAYLLLYMLFIALLITNSTFPIVDNLLGIKNAFLLNSTSLTLIIVLTFVSHMLTLGFILNRPAMAEKLDLVLLMLFATYGIITSNNLIVLLLFMEIALATTMFILLGKRRESLEATIKMVIMLILGSIFMIIGLGGLYTVLRGQNIDIDGLSISYLSSTNLVKHNIKISNIVLSSYLMVLLGIGVETGIVPFYMWLPDVYSGPDAFSSALFILLVDTADLYALLRISSLYGFIFGSLVDVIELVTNVIIAFSMASFILGELSALTQTNLRRIFGYSGVADAGYTLLLSSCLALSKAPPQYPSALLAITTFFIMFSNIALSNIISLIGIIEEKGISKIDEIRGLPWRLPILSTNLLIPLFSLAGVPPLVGFTAKFFVISAITKSLNKVVAVIVIVFFAVCAAYVLRIITNLCYRPSRFAREREFIIRILPFSIINLVLLICGILPNIILKFMIG